MTGRKSTDSNASQPAMKVVGFHVEGVPPSPAQINLLHDALAAGGGSPDPVIIPPSFQSEMAAARAGLPASPERSNTIPSFVPEKRNSPSIRELLHHGPAYGMGSADFSNLSTSQRNLAHTGSLPPMTGDAAADWKRFAASMAMTSPPQLSPRAGDREVKSQPPSTAVTPPVSPYQTDADRRMSSSHRLSAFELVQQQLPRHTDAGQHPATFSDGVRVRPIQSHMSATFSDGSKIPAFQDVSRHEIGTPRQQHGFQLPGDALQDAAHAIAATRQGPFASTSVTSASGQPSSSSSLRADTGAKDLASAPPHGNSPRVRRGEPALPVVPEVLTTVALGRGPSGNQDIREVKGAAEQPPRQAVQEDGKVNTPGASRAAAPNEAGKGKTKEGLDKDGKKPTSKAERRTLQERQRAEKAAVKEAEAQKRGSTPAPQQPGGSSHRAESSAPARPAAQGKDQQPALQAHQPATRQLSKVKSAGKSMVGKGQTSEMFAHLPQYKAVNIGNVFQESTVASKVHPAILRLGIQYADAAITGSNARCLAMLLSFKAVIQDYQTPESKELARDLTSQLNLSIQFLVECRPLSVSMGTAIKNLKLKVSHISASMPQEEAKLQLLEEIDTFIQEKITFADEQVAQIAQTKVDSGDVVLTFAFSSAVLNTLLAAKKEGKQFRVVVVDSRPHYEGRAMLTKLLGQGISCTYLQLNALSYTMQEVTKVFMGASGAMSNGTIVARAGSACVAMVADAMQRPVIICCETLKFVDRVQLDSITYNELGDPDSLATVSGRPELDALEGWHEQPQLELLNLMYDAMPCDYVTLIITEVGAVPPTSVPVVLREYRTEPKM